MQELTEEQRKILEEKLRNLSPEELKELQKRQCLFCQIIEGKVPSQKIYEDEVCLAIMDINPAARGHVLLLPKEHYVIMPQIPEEVLGRLFVVSKHLSQIILRKLKVEGTNLFVANGLVAGQRAQHFLIHIIPRKEGDGVLEVPRHLLDLEKREQLGKILSDKLKDVLGERGDGVSAVQKKREGKEKEARGEEKEEDKETNKETIEKKEKREKKGEKREPDSEEEKKEEINFDDLARLFK